MTFGETIVEFERVRGIHRAGTVPPQVLLAFEELIKGGVDRSVETGCGKTTVLLSHYSRRHSCFAYDDSMHDNSSVGFARDCPGFNPESVEFVFGATQKNVPAYAFDALDVAVIDGPHAYPFPELEYFYFYPHVKPGGILLLDDIDIPTLYRMYSFLREDPMWTLEQVVVHTAFFRRTDAPTLYPFGDGFDHQPFNTRRYPVAHGELDDQLKLL
jgi:hypothetical protein